MGEIGLIAIVGGISLYFQFFKFYIFGVYADCVGASINLGACSGRQHLKLIGCRGEGDVPVNQYGSLGIGNSHAGFHSTTRRVLIAESEGILLT